ncbi:positive regulation of androgen receptor activity protein [Trebouxia sp. C0010 RCD-2024]
MDQESALDEECLALESIFEDKFTRLQADKIRLVISAEGAEDDSSGSIPLYLELHIPPGYPDAAPQPDLSNINNAPYAPAVKDQAIAQITAEAESQLGECMLYNLAEWAKEQLPEWLEQSIVERSMPAAAAPVDPVAPSAKEESQFKGMSKNQKRRHFDKYGAAEEKPRGWDWVDIVSHLSKGPNKPEAVAA